MNRFCQKEEADPKVNRPSQNKPGQITLVLSNTKDSESLKKVIQLAHRELHRIAVGLSSKSEGNTWQPTAILNQACIRLIEAETAFKNHRHFFGAAAKAMRRVLIDDARKRHAKKRGGDWTRVEFTEAELIGFERPKDLLDFDTALKRLEAAEPRLSEIAELRVFDQLTTTEIATILGIGESTARRRWANARKQLASMLTRPTIHRRGNP
jgi:RNA polymerase sigma factor (TIGR02999 family)